MATTSRSILVSNLPNIEEVKLIDKLEIHFSKRVNGGGDVDQIVITEQCGQIGTFAVITFSEKETVNSVLKKQQHFYGKQLRVEPHLERITSSEDTVIKSEFQGRDACAEFPQGDTPSVLIIHGQYGADVLHSIATSTKTMLRVDEKSTKFTLTGPLCAIMQATARLKKCQDGGEIKTFSDDALGDTKMTSYRKDLLSLDEKTSTGLNLEQGNSELCHPEETSNKVTSSPSNGARGKVLKSSPKQNEHLKNVAKFDQKILDYIHVVNHEKINTVRKELKVHFEAKAGGVIEISKTEQNISPHNIEDAIKFLEDLVSETMALGLVTEIMDLTQFKETSKQTVQTATKQALQSTQCLVTQRARNRLEFYGTEHGVREEIAKLRAGILDRKSPDDSDIDDNIEHNMTERRNVHGGESPAEEMDYMSMVQDMYYPEEPNESWLYTDSIMTDAEVEGPDETVNTPDEPDMVVFVPPDDNSIDFGSVELQNYNGENLETSNEVILEYPPLFQDKDSSGKSSLSSADEYSSEVIPRDQSINASQLESPKKVGYVYIPSEDNAPPMEHPVLSETTRDALKGMATATGGLNGFTGNVTMNQDETDGAELLSVTPASLIGGMSSMEPSLDGVLPMEISVGGIPLREHFLGGVIPKKTFVGGVLSSEPSMSSPQEPTPVRDFTFTIRTGMTVIIRLGDLIDEFTDVIVTSADDNLRLKQGVGRAVRDAAGQELVEACQRWIQGHGPVKPGNSVWTTGGNLKCSNVLHVVMRNVGGDLQMVLKETIMDVLKTCAHSLKASKVSMPAIGAAGMSISNQAWAQAFYDAVCEITQLYDQGWMQLDTVVLVDWNKALIRELQSIFSNHIWFEPFDEVAPRTTSLSDMRQEPYVSAGTCGIYNGFAGVDCRRGQPSTGAVPRFKQRGPNICPRKGAYQPVMTPQSATGWGLGGGLSSWVQTSGRENSSFSKESANLNGISPDPDKKCVICLGEIMNEKKLRCGHRFCRSCVDTALKVHSYCPFCKQPL